MQLSQRIATHVVSLLAFTACVAIPVVAQSEGRRVALLLDAPGRGEVIAVEFAEQFRLILGGESDLAISVEMGDGSAGGVASELDALLKDPTVDAVVTLGVLGSQSLSGRGALEKPAAAAVSLDTTLQGFPLREGASGARNFYYLSAPQNLDDNLLAFAEVVTGASIAILADADELEAIPALADALIGRAKSAGFSAEVVAVEEGSDPVLPAEARAVFLTPLLSASEDAFRALVETLNARSLPTFSWRGPSDLESGVLAAAQPPGLDRRVARRIALRLRDAFAGAHLGEQAVEQALRPRLALNMATARRIGFSPSLELLARADLLQGEHDNTSRLGIADAAREAVERNLDLAARDRMVDAGQKQVLAARAALLPQIHTGAEARMIDRDRARASLGSAFRREVALDATLRQLLYDDDTWATYQIEAHSQDAREEVRERTRLDLIGAAAVAHLGVLRAGTIQGIEQENLALTRENLEEARSRVQAGSAGRQEVFRWENQIATNQRTVIDAQVETRTAAITVNELLHRDLESPYEPAEPDLQALGFLFTDPALAPAAGDGTRAQRLRDAMVDEGLARAPELRRLDAEVAGEERAYANAKRALYLPTFAVEGGVRERVHKSGAGDSDVQNLPPVFQGIDLPEVNGTNWAGGFRIDFPLFEGGRKFAEIERSALTLKRLRLERAAERERIATRIRSAFWRSEGAFQKIDFARAGAKAAERNYGVLSDNYARGRATILDLLDAQNASLVANQVAANAEFDFLTELVRAERAAGFFDFLLGDVERRELRERLEARLGREPSAP